ASAARKRSRSFLSKRRAIAKVPYFAGFLAPERTPRPRQLMPPAADFSAHGEFLPALPPSIAHVTRMPFRIAQGAPGSAHVPAISATPARHRAVDFGV